MPKQGISNKYISKVVEMAILRMYFEPMQCNKKDHLLTLNFKKMFYTYVQNKGGWNNVH